MKLLAWSIRHGGGARLARIVEEFAAHEPDLIALTDLRHGQGKELRAELADRGWPHVETTISAPIAIRVPEKGKRVCCLLAELGQFRFGCSGQERCSALEIKNDCAFLKPGSRIAFLLRPKRTIRL